MAGGPTKSKCGIYAALGIHIGEMQAQGKTAAAEATRYLLAAIGMSAINRHHHVRVDMEM